MNFREEVKKRIAKGENTVDRELWRLANRKDTVRRIALWVLGVVVVALAVGIMTGVLIVGAN